jgi:hypothetical protein
VPRLSRAASDYKAAKTRLRNGCGLEGDPELVVAFERQMQRRRKKNLLHAQRYNAGPNYLAKLAGAKRKSTNMAKSKIAMEVFADLDGSGVRVRVGGDAYNSDDQTYHQFSEYSEAATFVRKHLTDEKKTHDEGKARKEAREKLLRKKGELERKHNEDKEASYDKHSRALAEIDRQLADLA